MKKYPADLICFAIIAVSVFLFFLRLFWPAAHLLVTPDFGRSDAWHFSFATKYFLAENLKQGKLPVWSANLGGGFPLLAEGQTGTFFFPNLIFYRLFDPVTAYNLTLILALMTLGWGTYLLLRMLSLSRPVSLFSGLTLSFGGQAIAQMTHITLLQGMTLLPFVLAATLFLLRQKSLSAMLVLALCISQQFLAGFPQASFITLLTTIGMFIYLTLKKAARIADIIRLVISFLLAFGLSAIQFFPSWEFLKYSALPSGFTPQQAAAFSFPLKHLLAFFNPFAFGNPRFGTYPPFTDFHGSIFWENTGYVGILPIIAALFYFLKGRRSTEAVFFITALIASFLLMLGGGGPLYLIYSVWPFNLFRVPSRFIWVFVFSLVVLSAFTLEKLYSFLKRHGHFWQLIFFAFLISNLFYETRPWPLYHDLEPARLWLSRPISLSWLSKDERVFDLGSEVSYNRFFLKSGWRDTRPNLFLRNLLAPDSNLLWRVTAGRVYAGRSLARQEIMQELLGSGLTFTETGASVSADALKLLSLGSVRHILTAQTLKSPGLLPANSRASGQITISDYLNPGSLPGAYFAGKPVVATTAQEAADALSRRTFVPGQSVLLEKTVRDISSAGNPRIRLTRPSDTETRVKVRGVEARSLLVLNDTYYPGWTAEIDGKATEILPANIAFRAVVVPPGDHLVIFRYRPQSVRFGLVVSAFSWVIFIAAAAFLLVRVIFRIGQKVSRH